MSERALVRNTADRGQVKYAERLERKRRDRFAASLRVCLGQSAFRIVMADWLERGCMYESSFDPSGSVMYFREGRRNYALEMRADLEAADPGKTDLMEQERRERHRADAREIEAAHTTAAAEAPPTT